MRKTSLLVFLQVHWNTGILLYGVEVVPVISPWKGPFPDSPVTFSGDRSPMQP